jgi:hypothetical protein
MAVSCTADGKEAVIKTMQPSGGAKGGVRRRKEGQIHEMTRLCGEWKEGIGAPGVGVEDMRVVRGYTIRASPTKLTF